MPRRPAARDTPQAASVAPGSHRPAIATIALSLGALAWWGAALLSTRYAIDDTYIHLQFARNLAEGRGFRFWPADPPVYGCTSPAWVALLAAARLAGWDGVGAARFLSATFGLAGLVAFHRLSRRVLGGRWAWLPPLLLAANPWWVRWSSSGMEASAAACVALVVWLMVARPRHSLWQALALGVVCGVGILFRPELALLCPAAAIALALTPRESGRFAIAATGSKAAAGVIVASLLIGSCWTAFAYWHFGQLAPNAVHAKASEASWLVAAIGGAERLAAMIALSDAPQVIAIAMSLVLAMVGQTGTWRSPTAAETRAWLFAGAWSLGLLAFLFAGRAPMLSRYLLPAWPCLTLLGAKALIRCADWARDALRWKFGPRWATEAFGFVLVLPLGYAAATGCSFVYPHMRIVERNLPVYRAVAQYLRDETPKGSLIAVHEIGVFGYDGQRRLLDLGGLISPEVNRRPTRGQPEELTVALSFLRERGVTHYLDPHGKVEALLSSAAQSGRPLGAKFTLLSSWTFTGGTALTDRTTYMRRLYAIQWD